MSSNIYRVCLRTLCSIAIFVALGCGTSTTGTLAVTISGLPSSAAAAVTVTGVGYAKNLTGSQALQVAAGPYTATAQAVTSGGSSYSPAITGSPATVIAGQLVTIAIVYTVQSVQTNTGTLHLAISGLPAGTNASVSIAGPGGYSHSLTASGDLTQLASGSYSATAADVASGGATFSATVSGSPAAIAAGGAGTITVVYTANMVQPTTGTLHIAISGLPSGTDASVSISGPSGYSDSLTASGDLVQLTPGSYSATADDVSGGGATYSATVSGSPAVITAGGAETIAVVYTQLPTTGTLHIAISGLPAATNASVSISGPGGYTNSPVASGDLTQLAPGSYTAMASNVTGAGAIYAATVSGSPASVVAGQTATISIVYSLNSVLPTTGTLHIAISGLPAATNASVLVSGPSGYSNAVTATGDLTNLTPGSYSASAVNVVSGATYSAAVSGSPAVIVAGGAQTITVVYTQVPTTGTLHISISGLPAATNANVTISGPSGYTNSPTATVDLTLLAPGAYSAVASDVVTADGTYSATVNGSPATVVAGQTATIAIAYAIPPTTGTLDVAISGLPGGSNASVMISGPSAYTNSLTASEDLTLLAPGSYSATAANVVVSGVTYTAVVSGSPAAIVAGGVETITVVYSGPTGRLTVSVSGLPNGTSPDITVTGPASFSQHLTVATTLNNLAAGSYTVTAANVGASPVYTAVVGGSPASVTNGTTADVTVTYSVQVVQMGSLQVTMTGIPAGGAEGIAAWVTGPSQPSYMQGYFATLTQSQLLTGLAVGTYTLTGAVFEGDGVYNYNPTYDSTPITVVVNQTANASISFASDVATINVNVTGPSGAASASALQVQGLADNVPYSSGLTKAANTLLVAPGYYSISASAYLAGDVLEDPNIDVQIIQAVAGQTYTVNVTFGDAALALNAIRVENATNAGNEIIIATEQADAGGMLLITGTGFGDGGAVVNIDGVAQPSSYQEVASAWTTVGTLSIPSHDAGVVPVTVTTGSLSAHPGTSAPLLLDYWTADYYSAPDAGNGGSGGEGGLAIGPDGNPWFTERLAATIGTYNSTSGTFAMYGLDAGSQPVEIASGTDGNLWFTDAAHAEIGSISTSGAITLYPIPSGCNSYAITAGLNGKLWFTEPTCPMGQANSIGMVDTTNANSIQEFPIIASQALGGGIAQTPDGTLWFAEQSQFGIGTLSPTGVYALHPYDSKPGFLTTDVQGTIWYAAGSAGLFAMTADGVSYQRDSGSLTLTNRLSGDSGGVWIAGALSVGYYSYAEQTNLQYYLGNVSLTGIAAGGNSDAWVHANTTTSTSLIHLRH